jgi:hypothetical protein
MLTLRRSREPVERRERLAHASAARAQRARGVGLVLVSLGVAIWVAPFLVFIALWLAGVDTGSLPGSVGACTLVVALALTTRGRRMRAEGAERLLGEDPRPPVVYLRPFDADRAAIANRMASRLRVPPRQRFESTYEERLARTLRHAGPFVAVGDPTEGLPVLGAARLYAADTEWQETVNDLIARAAVVLLHAGEGEGLAWEVRHVTALGAPERVILSLPLQSKRRRTSRQERYDAFRRRCGDAFPRPLPDHIGDCQFLYFDADWTPRLLGRRDAPPPAGADARAVALQRLAREFKITWAPLWVRALAYGGAVLVPVLALVLLTGA